MVRVFACVFEEHNLWLVGVAGVICVLCWAGALLVLERVGEAPKRWRHVWLFLSGLAAGGGAWATHFVAMLAYHPGLPVSYAVGPTLASAAIGVFGAWAAFELLHPGRRGRTRPIVAGLTLAATITSLHYVGMAAVEAAARQNWDWGLVIASGLFVAAFSIAGLNVQARGHGFMTRLGAGALLVLGVVTLHVIAMGALTLTPDPALAAPDYVLDRTGLTITVSVGAAGLMLAAGAFSFADRRVAAAKLGAAARMHRLADSALEGLMIHQGETLLDGNATMAAMVGCDIDELIGRSIYTFVAPDSRGPLEAAERGERDYPVEVTLVGPKGLLEVEIFRRVLNPAEGLYVSAVRDISMRRRAERAEQSSSAKSQFLANISHELRSPLNAIIGYSELLIEESSETHTVEDAGRIRSAANHLLTLLNELMDISKVEAGRMEMAIEDCPTRTIVADVCDGMRAQAMAKGVALVVDVHEDVGHTRADAGRLKQCLFNLVSNAVKFTERGSVTLSVRETGDRVDFAVTDTGIGIAPTQLGRLFGDYMQADGSLHRIGGSGLGLAITKRLATLMSGDVSVRSHLGKGSTFTLTLPAAARAARTPIVLVVDDDPDAADLISRALVGAGMRTRIARTAAAGLEMALTNPFDLVVLDIHLPDISGWEVLAEVRAVSGPPVLVHTVDDCRKKAIGLGAAAYFMKPAPRDALTAAALRLVQEHAPKKAAPPKLSLVS